jgi:hypothetical protein
MIVDDIFEVKYGVNLELNSLELDPDGINFVSRTSKNNGVSAKVKALSSIEPIPAGTISVAAGGSVMESFLQSKPYYSGRDLYYLLPRTPLSDEVLLFYSLCLKNNQYRFSYGRQANVSLKSLKIPAPGDIPNFIKSFSLKKYRKRLLHSFSFNPKKKITQPKDILVVLSSLFDIANGIASPMIALYDKKQDNTFIPFLRPSYRQATSIAGFVKKSEVDAKYIFSKETLYVSTNGQGSHTYSYVSSTDFIPNSDVTVLIPKKPMTLSEKLFYAHCISINRYKFSYGRKPKGDRLKTIMLPDAAPDFVIDALMQKIIDNWNHKN